MDGYSDFRILVLADYSRKRLREEYRRQYRASKRKHGDSILWVGYSDAYDPDGILPSEFGYDGYSVTFDQSAYDVMFERFQPKKLIKWDIYVVTVFKDGHFDVYGETFDRTLSDVTGDFENLLDDLTEQLESGRGSVSSEYVGTEDKVATGAGLAMDFIGMLFSIAGGI